MLALALAIAAPATATPAAPTNLAVADLIAGPGVFDPQFTWSAVTGAKGYQVEVNSTDYWAPGSKVCCDNVSFTVPMTTFGIAFSPPVVLANDDEYFWRVRALDVANVAGPWTAGPSFVKGFGTSPSVPNLRLVGLDLEDLPTGSAVATPIILWDPSAGASSYRVDVTAYGSGSCDWSDSVWEKKTTVTGWTPLGWTRASGADPLSRGIVPSDDLLSALEAGTQYCVRVSPIDGPSVASGGPQVEADWTYLPAINAPAFEWSGPPGAGACSPCAPAALDYLRPIGGSTVGAMPVFTWNPIPGAQSYFIVVANDPFFTTIEDYAYTRITAYAPRKLSQTRGYPDKTSNYYWSVLPATGANGLGVSIDPVNSNPQAFAKQATPPTLLGPAGGALLSTAATVFHWTPVFEARRYRLQVSEDPSFANVIQEQSAITTGAVTDSTAYTSSTNYPTGETLYWRVQAELEDESSKFVGLRWSTTGTFQRQATSGGGGGTADTRFKASAKGYPVRRVYKTVTITVRNLGTSAPVASAAVRVSGAGVAAATKHTSSLGKVTFRIRATRYPGTVTYRITKTGYTALYFRQSVRAS